MKGDLVRTGWYCHDCHRVFSGTVAKVENVGRFHNLTCGTPMRKVRVVES